MAHDQGGEFMTVEWKDLLRQHGIQAVLSAAPWQRGRIERHGGIIEEMLSRIDQEFPIETSQQFDEALMQCFHAKNTMSIVSGYSPEQAVLGRASMSSMSKRRLGQCKISTTFAGSCLCPCRFCKG